jgi:anti-sigma B factor antagonist
MDADDRSVQPAPPGVVLDEKWCDRRAIISVRGAVDMLTAPHLVDALAAAQRKQPVVMIVDLSQTDFLASAGLSALLDANEAAQPETRFIVIADGPRTVKPMVITGVTDLIEVHSTMDAAFAHLVDAR